MTQKELFIDAVRLLKKESVTFALIGGLASSIFRKSPRATKDVDFLIELSSKKKSEDILKKLGLKVFNLREAELKGEPKHAIKGKLTPVVPIMGRVPGNDTGLGIDFFLTNLTWGKALERSQKHKVSFYDEQVPMITKEDFIIAKCISYAHDTSRFLDLDDLQSILKVQDDLDFSYLSSRMQELSVEIPNQIFEIAPTELKSISKKVRKDKKVAAAKSKKDNLFK